MTGQALAEVYPWTGANGLTLNPDKTHVGNYLEWSQGFEFLGYRFEAGNRIVRKRSLMVLKDKIRQQTKPKRGANLERIIHHLNPILRG